MTTLDLADYTVVLVDDEAFFRLVVAHMLAPFGKPKIVQASDVEEAMGKSWTLVGPVLIISDLNMPILNGLQFLKAVRMGQTGFERTTPFLMLTAYSDLELVDAALKLDIDGFLVKPTAATVLERKLAQIVRDEADRSWIRPVSAYQDVDALIGPRAPLRQKEIRHAASPLGTVAVGEEDKQDLLAHEFIALSERLQNSDLAADLASSIETLVAHAGQDSALGLISALGDLERRGLLGLDDLVGVLETSTRATRGRPPRIVKRAELNSTWREEFRALADVPEGAVLARDLNARDGHLFVVAGVELTPLILHVVNQLYEMNAVALPSGLSEDEDTGLYVRVPPSSNNAPRVVADSAGGIQERAIRPEHLAEGSVVSRNVYTVDGTLYLPAGATVTKRAVALLNNLCELGKLREKIWVAA